MVFHWDGKTVFVDPFGGAAPFKQFGTPDVVLVTDIHCDHFNKDTLTAVVKEKTVVIAPEAVPMYNLTPTRLRFHNKGRGNGNVMTFGGKGSTLAGTRRTFPRCVRSRKSTWHLSV